MKVQLDTTALRRELHKVIYDDKKCADWVREFEYTLGCWGTNENPHPFAMSLIVEAEGYRASQSIKKMKAAVIKELGADASSEDVNKRLVEKYGEERVKTICDTIRRAKNLSADAPTREDGEFKSDSGDAGNLESATSAESLPAMKAQKHPHGEFNNVMLTDDEYTKWVMSGSDADELIEELSSYLASSGKRYKSHYATLINWRKRKATESKPQPQGFKTAADRDREEIKKIADYYAKRREDNGKEAV